MASYFNHVFSFKVYCLLLYGLVCCILVLPAYGIYNSLPLSFKLSNFGYSAQVHLDSEIKNLKLQFNDHDITVSKDLIQGIQQVRFYDIKPGIPLLVRFQLLRTIDNDQYDGVLGLNKLYSQFFVRWRFLELSRHQIWFQNEGFKNCIEKPYGIGNEEENNILKREEESSYNVSNSSIVYDFAFRPENQFTLIPYSLWYENLPFKSRIRGQMYPDNGTTVIFGYPIINDYLIIIDTQNDKVCYAKEKKTAAQRVKFFHNLTIIVSIFIVSILCTMGERTRSQLDKIQKPIDLATKESDKYDSEKGQESELEKKEQSNIVDGKSKSPFSIQYDSQQDTEDQNTKLINIGLCTVSWPRPVIEQINWLFVLYIHVLFIITWSILHIMGLGLSTVENIMLIFFSFACLALTIRGNRLVLLILLMIILERCFFILNMTILRHLEYFILLQTISFTVIFTDIWAEKLLISIFLLTYIFNLFIVIHSWTSNFILRVVVFSVIVFGWVLYPQFYFYKLLSDSNKEAWFCPLFILDDGVRLEIEKQAVLKPLK